MSNKPFHYPVLLQQTTELLLPRPDTIYFDCTLGHGGHTIKLLQAGATVYGFDADKSSLEIATNRIEQLELATNFIPLHQNFTTYLDFAKSHNIHPQGVLFDLGLNQWQYSQARGFSFSGHEPLDMRLDNSCHSPTAADVLNYTPAIQLYQLFSQLSQEKYSQDIVTAIIKSRPIHTTNTFSELISDVYQRHHHHPKINPATKIFMALRMIVNHELDNLEQVLHDSLDRTFTQTTFCFITFHSGEDRLVKNFLQQHLPEIQLLTSKPIRPDREEIRQNPASRSALVRSYRIR